MSESEIARILRAIEQEYEAAQRGLSGLAECARHAFITARMERVHALHGELQAVVGDTREATRLLAEQCERMA